MEFRLVTILAIAILLAGSFIISAEITWPNNPNVEVKDPNFLEKILDYFRTETFTIVGQDRDCDAEPYYRFGQISYFARENVLGYWSFNQGTVGGDSNALAEKYCSSGHGLFDVYCQTNSLAPAGALGNFRFEMKDGFYFTCSSNCAKCNVELYCCPDDCDVGGNCPSGTTCTTKSVPSSLTLYNYDGSQTLSSYKYCKENEGCSGSPTTCWRIKSDNSGCESATYTCDQSIYKSSCPIGSYIYSSPSQCQASIPTCTPDPSCREKTCIGETCKDSCGNVYTGTKDCSNNGLPTVDDPEVKVTITEMYLKDVNGNRITSDSVIRPGDKVKVHYELKVKYGDFRYHLCNSPSQCLTGPIQHDSEKEYLVEVGVIPADVAQSWFPDEYKSITFSAIQLFATSNIKTECCQGQENVNAYMTKITQSKIGYTWDWFWGKDSEEYLTFEDELEVYAPSSSTIDKCPVKGVSTNYWGGTNPRYVVYIVIKNDCYAREGVLTGYTEGVSSLKPLVIDTDYKGTSIGGYIGDKCKDNGDCQSGICEIGDSLWDKTLKTKRCKEGDGEDDKMNDSFLKYPLTREEIGKSTTDDLITSACYSRSECAEREDYSVYCIPTATLVDDGTLTKAEVDNLFSDSKALLSLGMVGAGTGLAICLGSAITGPGALVGCGIAGSLTIIGALEAYSQLSINTKNFFSDELEIAIESGDSNKVGICTAEKGLDLGEWIKKVGKSINITGDETWDGLIIIGGGIFVLFLFLNIVGGRK